jgi:hypothetical protein
MPSIPCPVPSLRNSGSSCLIVLDHTSVQNQKSFSLPSFVFYTPSWAISIPSVWTRMYLPEKIGYIIRRTQNQNMELFLQILLIIPSAEH